MSTSLPDGCHVAADPSVYLKEDKKVWVPPVRTSGKPPKCGTAPKPNYKADHDQWAKVIEAGDKKLSGDAKRKREKGRVISTPSRAGKREKSKPYKWKVKDVAAGPRCVDDCAAKYCPTAQRGGKFEEFITAQVRANAKLKD